MPRLQATMLDPKVDAALFRQTTGWEFPKDEVPPEPPEDEPFETDEEAVGAAIAWIVARFGPLPAHTTLEPESVQHSASGNDEPQYEWDAGHSIVLRQCYRGVPTDLASTMYIRGRSHFSGYFELASFEEVEGTGARIVDRNGVVDVLVRLAREEGIDQDVIDAFRSRTDARPQYVRSNLNAGTEAEGLHVPSWSIGGGWWVDGATAKLWRDS
jgi:hypothetical protein